MDHRYPNRIVNTMDSAGLRGKYDHLVLAGAGYGVVHKREWQTTFFDQLRFAIDHHQVKELIILEHRDCGAYREFLGVTPDDPVKERQAHIEQASKAVKITLATFSKLEKAICLLLPNETIEELPLEK
jgi:carbonic anhydrase